MKRHWVDLAVNLAVPPACLWVKWKEGQILKHGEPLPEGLQDFARRIGVKCPEKIRILVVRKIPLLQQKFLSIDTAAVALNYGIFLRADCIAAMRIYKHEIAHVLQYEQLAGVKGFLNQYFREVLTYGYPNAPMEKEARAKENL